MATKKTERVAAWLTPEQVAWLKTKGNSSETVRALVNEAMNIDRFALSLRAKKEEDVGRCHPESFDSRFALALDGRREGLESKNRPRD